jgi:sarcosine oxidase subunit beta
MGASIAYHLAKRGQKGIILLEKEPFFGQGATGRCAGGVRYQFATEINIRLSMASLPMLENFTQELGQEIDYRHCGYLFLLSRQDDVANFRRTLALQQRLGVETEWLDGDEIRRRLPTMQLDDILGGTFNPKDGLVDPNSVVMGYINAAQRLGVQVYTDAQVTAIQTRAGNITGLQTPLGSISTQLIVNAAGPWAGLVSEMAGLEIPLTPVRRQWCTTTEIPEIPGDFPFVIDFARSLYFHREGLGLLTGMSNPDEPPGFDQSIDSSWELTHLDCAIARLPVLERAGLTSRMAGLYEVTPDAHPIYGHTPIKGFYLCTGFSGHGFMHGPVSGMLMAEIILEGQAKALDISSLDLARFWEGRLVQEYNVV